MPPESQSPTDSVAAAIAAWRVVDPKLDVTPIAILARIAKIRSIALAEQERILRDVDLSPADFVTIVTLRRRTPPFRLSQTDLAAALGLTAGTVSVRVDRLVQLGFATRTRSPQDARVHWVELTPAGEDVFAAVAPQHLAAEAKLLTALTQEQQDALANMLADWLAALESRSSS